MSEGTRRTLGLSGWGEEACAEHVDAATLRTNRTSTRLRPYERLFGPSADPRQVREEAERILERGWELPPYPPVRLDLEIPWDESARVSRSWSFHIHAWDPLEPLLLGYSQAGVEEWLRVALATALEWVHRFHDLESASDFAWYDVAVGVRGHRLAYLIDASARSTAVDDATLEILLESMTLHQEALACEERFSGHTNHGFFQAAGQLACAMRLPEVPGMRGAFEQARSRIYGMLDRQFTREGVHREHSPAYHLLVLKTLDEILRAGLLVDPTLQERRNAIEEALAWFVLPDGTLAMFGDTDQQKLAERYPIEEERCGAALRFVLSEGTRGRAPPDRVHGFVESGYFVARDRWPDAVGVRGRGSYLAQICGFHSRAHKHADDLSFVWYEDGGNLLVDAGRFGYLGRTAPESKEHAEGFWYSHPYRMYVESTRAHNAVEIDGRDYPRRGVKPYGSALRNWGTAEDVAFSEARVVHFGTIVHRRVIVFLPGEWLLIVDCLDDRQGLPHRFTQWFHFGPEVDVESERAGAIRARLREGRWLVGVPLLRGSVLKGPIRGQGEPEIQGWMSPGQEEITPCAAVAWEAEGVARHRFAALFQLGEEGVQICDGIGTVGWNGRLRFGWTAAGTRHRVRVSRGGRWALRVRCETRRVE